MKLSGKKKNADEEEIFDPLSGLSEEPDKKGDKKAFPFRFRKKNNSKVVRAAELEQLLESGEDIDPEAVISMYRPRRRAERFGAALLRLDRLYLFLLLLLLLIALLFGMSFMQEKMGNFTINLNRLELFRKGISISADGNFTEPTARLTADAVVDATNISIGDLPNNLDDIDGNHNGMNYMAYTYYVRNAGKEDVAYEASVLLHSYAKNAENAVRVAVWRNGERTVYAEPAADGKAELGCVNFTDHDTACVYREENFRVGDVDKYTIVIWMEGDDPDCVDSVIGGSVEFSMDIRATTEDDTSLFYKFVKDIKDTLTGERPINAAGNDAPGYFNNKEITWENRRNQ